jgi:two-component sensor histidine kinase
MTQDAQAARVAELEADNARLRRLLEERDAPGKLRHRLRNTLAMLRVVVRRSAETRDGLDAYVAHLEDRIAAIARAQEAADRRGEVDLHSIVADELHFYGASEGEQAQLSGPLVLLRPRAAQVLALAMHELAVNAVEHGALMADGGGVEVSWRVATDGAGTPLTLTWKETGLTGLAEPSRRGFGTEVLQDTLRYELKAETALAFEPDGLRCTIRCPLPAQIGRVESAACNRLRPSIGGPAASGIGCRRPVLGGALH